MKHTVGKWVVAKTPNDDHNFCIACGYFRVAEINICDEQLSNAKLIAAAPELLHSLNLMIDSFGHYDLELTDKEGMDAIKKSKQIIKQATS